MRYSPYPGLPPSYVAEILGVPARTARYWKKQGRMPEAFGRLWAYMADHDLGQFDAAWRGWRLHEGVLYSPEGNALTPGEAQAALFRRLNPEPRERGPAQYLLEV